MFTFHRIWRWTNVLSDEYGEAFEQFSLGRRLQRFRHTELELLFGFFVR